MRPSPVDDRPGPLRRVDGDERELGWLLRAQEAGVPVAPTAVAWVRGHALLDAVVDAFYAALVELPGRVAVRRPGGDGLLALRGRPALLALKHVWADTWRCEAVLRSARAGAGWRPAPRPVLVHAADLSPDDELARGAGAALGRRVHAWRDDEGRLARLALP